MFCDYLINLADRQNKQLCVMDLDIGRNRIYPGAISLEIINSSGNSKN